MNKQDKELIQEALDNNWDDRLFYYYQVWISANTVRPQDPEGMYQIRLELKRLISEKLTKNETPSENPQVKSIKLK